MKEEKGKNTNDNYKWWKDFTAANAVAIILGLSVGSNILYRTDLGIIFAGLIGFGAYWVIWKIGSISPH